MAETPQVDSSAQMDEVTKRLLSRLLVPRSQVNPPPGAQLPRESGGQQPQQFVHGLFSMIQAGVQEHKQKELRHATGVLQSLNNGWSKAQELAGGDEEKAKQIFSQMPEVTHIFEDKKNVKQLGKLLQFDFTQPEKKKTVWHEALGKVVEASKQLPMIKAISKLMGQRKEQAQDVDPAKREGEASEMAKRFAGQAQPAQPPDAVKVMEAESQYLRAQADMKKASNEARQVWEFKLDAKGNYMAMNRLTGEGKPMLVNGQPVTGQVKGKDGPMSVPGSPPFGYYRGGVGRTPESPDWTPEDGQRLEAAQAAWAKGNAEKDRRTKLVASAWANTKARVYTKGVLNKESGALEMVTSEQIAQNPGLYAPAGQGVQIKNRLAIFNELDYTMGQLKDAIGKLGDEDFDARTRAKIAVVLNTSGPEGSVKAAWDSFVQGGAADSLSDPQIEYVTALVSAQESALGLRSLGGMGQGSETVRHAILKMLPTAATPNKKYATRQFDLTVGEIAALRVSVNKLLDQQDKKSKAAGAGAGDSGETVIDLTSKKP